MLAPGGEQPTLTTPRLRLRPLVGGDARRISLLASDRRVTRYLLSFAHPYPPGAARRWIARAHAGWISGLESIFAITLPREGGDDLIGGIGLHHTRVHNHAELAYWLGYPYWGHGYVAEAGAAILRWGFRTLKLHRVFAQYMGDNHASGRVLAKLGFSHEGVRRGHYRKDGRWYDVQQFGMLRSEWRSRS